jgi:hypothetical protein
VGTTKLVLRLRYSLHGFLFTLLAVISWLAWGLASAISRVDRTTRKLIRSSPRGPRFIGLLPRTALRVVLLLPGPVPQSTFPIQSPCTGQESAPICTILELLFGSVHGPGIEELFSCTGCGEISQTTHYFPLLGLPVFRHDYRRETDPRFIPSVTLLARFIGSLVSSPRSSLCTACLHETDQEQHFKIAGTPWMWFEVNEHGTMAPSLMVSIKLPQQSLIYNLHAVIYLGDNHFTARMHNPSGGWWNYDGMRRYGAARCDYIDTITLGTRVPLITGYMLITLGELV